MKSAKPATSQRSESPAYKAVLGADLDDGAPKAAPTAGSLARAEERRGELVWKREAYRSALGVLAKMVEMLDVAITAKDDEIRGLRL